MKAHLIEVGLQKEEPLHIKKIDTNCFSGPFHFHNKWELNYVVSSYGKSIVGDSIRNFSAGDLVLLSPNLPHIWYNDPSFLHEDKNQSAQAIVIYFTPDFFTNLTTDDQIVSKIDTLLEKSKRGVRFFGYTQEYAISKLNGIINRNGLLKIIDFLDIIHTFLNSSEYEVLASIGYQHSIREKDTLRMNAVYQYLIQNFANPISLKQIASVANLTPPAFCNFFKKRTQKSFSSFLNELRIGHACKLLLNEELSIADICYESGYQNMTNFNKTFKEITGKTPTQYRKEINMV